VFYLDADTVNPVDGDQGAAEECHGRELLRHDARHRHRLTRELSLTFMSKLKLIGETYHTPSPLSLNKYYINVMINLCLCNLFG